MGKRKREEDKIHSPLNLDVVCMHVLSLSVLSFKEGKNTQVLNGFLRLCRYSILTKEGTWNNNIKQRTVLEEGDFSLTHSVRWKSICLRRWNLRNFFHLNLVKRIKTKYEPPPPNSSSSPSKEKQPVNDGEKKSHFRHTDSIGIPRLLSLPILVLVH